jgi:hypothetical protein
LETSYHEVVHDNSMPIHESNELDQGSPASFFLQAKKSFLIAPNSQEPPALALFFKTNHQFSLSLTVLIQK